MEKLKWGIMACGRIAATFAKAVNYSKNSTLYAVAARDISRAEKFAEEFGANKFYGSYKELCEDKEVDIIYIASPMAQHYEQAKMCLLAGKNVLCEKTITLNNKQFAELCEIAREKDVFFMEAMWMKFLPAFLQAKAWVNSGLIGNVKMVKADFSNLCPFNPDDRLFLNSLGGGCLLDLGVYPITFACEFLGYKPAEIISNAVIGKTNVDTDAAIMLRYENGSFADITAGFDMENENAAFIIGDKGRIRFGNWFFCTADVMLYDTDGNMLDVFHCPHLENGYEFEIFECEGCIAQGKKQSEVNPLWHTAAVMDIMDKCRSDWGLIFEGE